MKERVNKVEGDTLYNKLSNGRYRAVGPDLQHSTLNEGLWLIRQKNSNISYTSVAHLVDNLRDYELTIDDITTIEEYKDKIIHNVLNRIGANLYSIQDIVEITLVELITVIKKENHR